MRVTRNMTTISPSNLLAQLQWRYATKQFDPNRKIPSDVWSALEQSLVLTPSSFGLQPWKFIVVTDPAMKQSLLSASWNQSQVTDCSHHVVFAARKATDEKEVDRFLQSISAARGVDVASLAGYRGMMTGFMANAAKGGWLHEWAIRQTYIAIGQFMASCAVVGVDACPMEGIAPDQYDKLLGLEGGEFATAVACAVGYRSSADKYATLAKVRYPASEVIKHV
jgi:nitroreductase